MKIWVIGGAGYIGSHVCKALLRAGHEVVVYDNLSTGLRQNLLPGVIFREGSILDIKALSQAAQEFKFDGVIHLAALKAAGDSMLVPETYGHHNIVGSLNLIHAVVAAEIPRFIFSSTAAVYGEPKYLPMDESHPTHPENFYGHTKLVVEGLLDWYGRLQGLKYAALRYFNAVGYDPEGELMGLEKNPANLVPVVMETAMGIRKKLQVFGSDYDTPDGTCIRDYIHVTDLASAHVASLEHLAKGGESFMVNLGTGSGLSVMEVIEKARQITGKEIPVERVGRRAGDPAVVVASAEQAKVLLGWKAEFSDVETLLQSTWKAYQSHFSTTSESSERT